MSLFSKIAFPSLIGLVGISCFAQNVGLYEGTQLGSEAGFVAWFTKYAPKNTPKTINPSRAEFESLSTLHLLGQAEILPVPEVTVEPSIADNDPGNRQRPQQPDPQSPPNKPSQQEPEPSADGDALDSLGAPPTAPDLDSLDLMWPVETRTISSAWGPRRRTTTVIVKTPAGSRRVSKPYMGSHKGIDLTAPLGTGIFAAMDGRVNAIGRDRAMGNYVSIDHGGGIETFYAHNKANLISMGEMVRRGQIIATVGSTGHSTGPHVHFEVRVNGQQVNPAPYINDTEELTPEMINLKEQALSKAKASKVARR